MENSFSPDPYLTTQQHRVITLIAAGSSLTQAAVDEDIHRNTIGYWRRTSPSFARELEFAVREQRLYWYEQATAMAPKAMEVISQILNSPDASPSLRFRAATMILKMTTDPQSKAIKPLSTVAPEIEALSGQFLALRKEMLHPAQSAQECTNAPDSSLRLSVSAGAHVLPAQTRTRPQLGRNSQCPCKSGLKYKRCCANRTTLSAAA